MNRIYSAFSYDFNALPRVVRGLMAGVAAGFLLSWFAPDLAFRHLAFSPDAFVARKQLWTLLSYPFLSYRFSTMFFTCLYLVFFGAAVERHWGAGPLLRYLFLCYLSSALGVLALAPGQQMPVFGAIWVGYWLVIAFAMLYPDSTVYFLLLPVRSVYLVAFAVLSVYFAEDPILRGSGARFAPLLGMLCGFLYIRYSGDAWIRLKHWAAGLLSREDEEERPARRQPPRRAAPGRADPPEDPMAEVDRILDKILASGMESLTEDEKLVMKRYSDKGRKPS